MERKGRDTSWNRVAKWYDKHVSEESDYHKDIVVPGAARMLSPKQGMRILDVGCGEGVLCRQLSSFGAIVTGVDSSEDLISLAKGKPSKNPIEYVVADAAAMASISSGQYDAAVSMLAIQNMDPLFSVIKEMARAVKKDGTLVLVMNHPCFRIPRQSGWGYDEQRKLQYRRIDRYMTSMKVPIQMHPGSDPTLHTWSFHRPLSLYVEKLSSVGFAVTGLEEWVSNRKSKPGAKAKAENAARAEIPLFLAIKAVKLSQV